MSLEILISPATKEAEKYLLDYTAFQDFHAYIPSTVTLSSLPLPRVYVMCVCKQSNSKIAPAWEQNSHRRSWKIKS